MLREITQTPTIFNVYATWILASTSMKNISIPTIFHNQIKFFTIIDDQKSNFCIPTCEMLIKINLTIQMSQIKTQTIKQHVKPKTTDTRGTTTVPALQEVGGSF